MLGSDRSAVGGDNGSALEWSHSVSWVRGGQRGSREIFKECNSGARMTSGRNERLLVTVFGVEFEISRNYYGH